VPTFVPSLESSKTRKIFCVLDFKTPSSRIILSAQKGCGM
jgi:hypothetical protein